MADVLLPYARHSSGRMIHVDEALNGAACDCACPQCGQQVHAVQGPETAHHFRHAPDYDRALCDPVTAGETTAHKTAKQIIAEAGRLIVPMLVAKYRHLTHVHQPALLIRFTPEQATIEAQLGAIVPDVLIEIDGRQLAVEVYVRHRTNRPAKLAEFERRGMDAIEIDLSGVSDEDVAAPARFGPIVLQAAGRHWLFNRHQEDIDAALREATEARWAAERQRQAEIAERVAKQRAAQQALEARYAAEREADYAKQREEMTARAQAALAASRARETERAARVEVDRQRQRAAWADHENRTNDRVAYLRSLPRRPIADDLWPACLCRTPFLWRGREAWQCVACDPPLVPLQHVRAVRGDRP